MPKTTKQYREPETKYKKSEKPSVQMPINPGREFRMNVKPSKDEVDAVNKYRREQKQTAFSERDVADLNGLNYLTADEFKRSRVDDKPKNKRK